MNFILDYQNEILAVGFILIVILMYMIIKRKKVKESDFSEEAVLQETEENQTTEDADIEEKKVAKQEEHEHISHNDTSSLLDGKEEGDFGEEVADDVAMETTKKISTRVVPPHAKVTKDDFEDFSGERILVAEDNIINQKVILGLLADSGIKVVVANDGVEVLNVLKEDDDFLMILMDAHMPRMDGFEATRKIRKNSQYDHIVVVALSGDIASDDIKKMSEAGMTEHLEKPLKMDALYDVLYKYTPDDDTQSAANDNDYVLELLNVEEGLDVCAGDAMFYNDMLKEFINDYGNSGDILTALFKDKKFHEIDMLLLDIIGVSANLGANKLNNISQTIKKLIRNQDGDFSGILAAYKENLQLTIEKIKDYLRT